MEAVVRGDGCVGTSILAAVFCCESNTALKNEVYFFKVKKIRPLKTINLPAIV